jgi:hypothetical protein
LVSQRISILEVVEIFGNPKIIHYTLFLVSRRISILEVVEIFENPEIIHYTHPAFQSFQVLDRLEHDG